MKQKGFSIVELLIVISIITIMSTLAITRLPALTRRVKIDSANQLVLNTVRQVRHDSISIIELTPGSGVYPSYGVYFNIANPQRVTVYADCVIDDNNDGIIDNRDNFTFNSSSTACAGGNGFVKNVLLDSKIKIRAMRSIQGNAVKSESKAYIEYLRPEPSIWIALTNGSLLPLGRLEVDISDTGNNETKTLVFWTTGAIGPAQ